MANNRTRFEKIIAIAMDPGAFEDEAIAALRKARELSPIKRFRSTRDQVEQRKQFEILKIAEESERELIGGLVGMLKRQGGMEDDE
jgi:hypothetical protein